MPTIDDLRTALHAEAAATPSLSSADVLRQGRRMRARRQVLSATGAAAAVVAVVATVAVGPWQSGPAEVPNPGAAAPAASSSFNPWVLGTEGRMEDGKHTFTLDDPEISGVRLIATRMPGVKGQPGTDNESRPADLVVEGVPVTITEESGADGPVRRLEWTAHNNRFEAVVPDELTTEDLIALVSRINSRYRD